MQIISICSVPLQPDVRILSQCAISGARHVTQHPVKFQHCRNSICRQKLFHFYINTYNRSFLHSMEPCAAKSLCYEALLQKDLYSEKKTLHPSGISVTSLFCLQPQPSLKMKDMTVCCLVRAIAYLKGQLQMRQLTQAIILLTCIPDVYGSKYGQGRISLQVSHGSSKYFQINVKRVP